MDSSENERASGFGNFLTTRWSVVLKSQDGSSSAQEALATLCRNYWQPLYAYVRRRGYSPHDAQDLTQAFFERWLEKGALGSVDRDRGRFRSYLLGAMQHFLAKVWQKEKAIKRGGGIALFSIDAEEGESWSLQHCDPGDSPEASYDRQWALRLLERVRDGLRQEMEQAGKGRLFELVQASLAGERQTGGYAEVAAALGLSEGAVKVAVHRLRERFRERLRAEVAQTVGSEAETEEELRTLIRILSV
jgi:RNA polymerase sigma factor (sigma-70 family)